MRFLKLNFILHSLTAINIHYFCFFFFLRVPGPFFIFIVAFPSSLLSKLIMTLCGRHVADKNGPGDSK